MAFTYCSNSPYSQDLQISSSFQVRVQEQAAEVLDTAEADQGQDCTRSFVSRSGIRRAGVALAMLVEEQENHTSWDLRLGMEEPEPGRVTLKETRNALGTKAAEEVSRRSLMGKGPVGR